MMKKTLAVLLGVVTIGAAVGTITELKSYADGVKLQIAGQETETEDTSAEAAKKGFSTVSTAELVEASSSLSYSGVADIAEAAMPSIVAITNKSVQEVRSYFRGQTFQYESESCGSGIIIGENETELWSAPTIMWWRTRTS